MALTWDDKEKELANANMMIAGTTRGPGGSPGQRWDGLDRNPKPGDVLFGVEKGGQTFFEFLKALGLDRNDKIAGGPYRMNKEGNAEVWKFGGPNYHYLPMPKSYYDLIESVRGMNFKKADAAAGTKIINELPRGGWPSRNSHRGVVDDDKLLDTMKRATAAFKA